MTLIKICGITNNTDAVEAAGLGVDMLGFVFYRGSKRCVDAKAAREIINEVPDAITKVGVFVDEPARSVLSIAEDAGLDALQFHGDEPPEYCAAFRSAYKVIKAFRPKSAKDLKSVSSYDVDYYLFDTFKSGSAGGTGEIFDWKMLKDFEFMKPVILSGGLNPRNVAGAISEVSPFGVDVSTGVEESPGRKSLRLMREFVDEVRKV